ncbi:MAG: hypothetical protein C0489_07375 [Candidatus Accumulibacter sp.]|nr:hypothetical protein [Accumulibacter sp.]MBA4093896.1 hypothetical protein [Accumulibacter sp.]
MGQMQTVSVRMSDEDFQWLLALQEPGARTPSERLRALLAKAREQESRMRDPELCASWMRGLTQPFVDAITAFERKTRTHSDIVRTVAEWAPQIMATLASSRLTGDRAEQDATEAEAVLTQQSLLLLTALLRSAVTLTLSAYDKKVLDGYLPDIIELANIISTKSGKETQNA